MKILGTGSCVPEKIITNEDLCQFLDTSDEWITTRTGIKERHVITTEKLSELSAVAARELSFRLTNRVSRNRLRVIMRPGVTTTMCSLPMGNKSPLVTARRRMVDHVSTRCLLREVSHNWLPQWRPATCTDGVRMESNWLIALNERVIMMCMSFRQTEVRSNG